MSDTDYRRAGSLVVPLLRELAGKVREINEQAVALIVEIHARIESLDDLAEILEGLANDLTSPHEDPATLFERLDEFRAGLEE